MNLNLLNSVYSRKYSPKIKDGVYVINLDEFKSMGAHWIALKVNDTNIIYFDSFEVEHIPKEIAKFIGNKNIITYIHRIQAHDMIMCGYFCIGLINIILKLKSLLDYIKLFSPKEYEKNDKIILKYFK